MKTLPVFIVLLLLALSANSQCERTQFVLSPSVYQYTRGKIGVSLEAGFLPVSSKGFVTLKGTLWTETPGPSSVDTKGVANGYVAPGNTAFVGAKYTYVPQAFENLPRKWLFGVAGGVYTQNKQSNKPALELSTAYTVRMAAGSYSGGTGFLKLEGSCLLTPTGARPGLGAGIFLLL